VIAGLGFRGNVRAPFPGRRRVLARPLLHEPGPARFLAILLCYNDDDVLDPVIRHLVANRHDVVLWNHGSEDRTEEIALSWLGRGAIEYQALDRSEVPFKDLYGICARYLVAAYGGEYDWLSWPDQDEILEGPDLSRPYHEQVSELLASGGDWVEFDNFVFWFTAEDDARIADPVERIRRYNLYVCPPRIRAWRFSKTNERRLGNSNPIDGVKAPVNWPLRHYPMRTIAQARRRAHHDRNQPGFQFGDKNWHYETFRDDDAALLVPAEKLHVFDGRTLRRDVTWEFYRRPERLAQPAPRRDDE
jgi:glycosyltransferase involved in cell wall biosynthesis